MAFATSAATAKPTPTPRRRFIIDCDPGVDDAVAILMAISECSRSEDDQLLAVTTTHGNVDLDKTTANACKVLDALPAGNALFDARRVPIHRGCPGPLIRSDHAYFPWHGVDGLGDAGLPDAERHVHGEHAALALIRLCNKYPGEVRKEGEDRTKER
jgi:purine nucleosidase